MVGTADCGYHKGCGREDGFEVGDIAAGKVVGASRTVVDSTVVVAVAVAVAHKDIASDHLLSLQGEAEAGAVLVDKSLVENAAAAVGNAGHGAVGIDDCAQDERLTTELDGGNDVTAQADGATGDVDIPARRTLVDDVRHTEFAC